MRDVSGNWNIDEGSQYKDGNDFVVLNPNGTHSLRVENAFDVNNGLNSIHYKSLPLSGPDGFLDVVRELHPANYVPGEGYHILVGDSSDNYIDGSGATSISSMGNLGDDRIVGSSGNDYHALYGNAGDDTFISNAGDDVLFGSGSDRFYAGSGDDYINFGVDENGVGTEGRYYSEAGNDRLNMNDEWAWLHYDYEETPALTPILVNFSDQIQVINGANLEPFTVRDQYNNIDTFLNTERGAHFWGSEFDDEIVIGDVGNFFYAGGGGNDTITILGDNPKGTVDADWVADASVDWNVNDSVFSYVINGKTHTISINGEISGLSGSSLSDTLTGDENSNNLHGRDGDDTISGNEGNDTIYGKKATT